MYDLPPDLDRLRTLETWLTLTLDRVRQQIKTLEQRQQPQQPAPQPPPAPPPRPRTPDWGITEAGIGTPTTEIHRGNCWAAGKTLTPITAERARNELADGAKSCDACRPDRPLGMPPPQP
ncbi:DUF6233 domain-containing protein [Streptomyces sp. EN16]|uniref:DUF6233 domain-containing protein n=1 Tax=Streptomyces sp. EN16 TaxID=212773 RepID=UPI00099F9D92|nr:DUF6233 domain-containing protein [Streptomyces sp. EN16]